MGYNGYNRIDLHFKKAEPFHIWAPPRIFAGFSQNFTTSGACPKALNVAVASLK